FSVVRRDNVRRQFLQFLGGQPAAVRYELVRSLYLAMREDEVFSKVFDLAKRDSDQAVRFAAIAALAAQLGRSEVQGFLDDTLRMGSGPERTAAALALTGDGSP